MLPELPNPTRVYYELKTAIEQNMRPTILLHEFLDSGKKEANIVANTLIDNREALKLITSPLGRKWIHYWLDDTLNYLQKYAEQATY